MRRICLFLFIILISPIYGGGNNEISSKNAALSFCTEGKTWNYILYYLDGEGTHQEPYSYMVRGDTVIGNIAYKKLYYQKDGAERLAFMMREDGYMVYKRHPEKEEFLLFDFSRDDVGQVHSWKSSVGNIVINWMIYAIDNVQVKNNIFRRYCCYQQYSETELDTIEELDEAQTEYWVEGIGSANMGIEADGIEIPVRLPGITEYFVSCDVNGECIFTADDFSKPSYTSDVQRLRNTDSNLESVYDILGKRLNVVPHKGLYIQNGKKVKIGGSSR